MVQAAFDTGVHLAFAISDHPWVDSADGAAVRIAMSVAAPGAGEGRRLEVTAEREGKGEGLDVELVERSGVIHADLSVGANVSAAQVLQANSGLTLIAIGFLIWFNLPKVKAHMATWRVQRTDNA